MNFQSFCTEMKLFTYDKLVSSYADKTHEIGYTESFYADCYLHQQLSNLIVPTATKTDFPSDAKTDFETALQYLFLHYPLCNLESKKEYQKPRFDFDTKQATSECQKWFIFFYQNHSQLCQKLFPIITFILGDSYEYLHEKSLSNTEDSFQEELDKFICQNLTGDYQQYYLYSLLSAGTAKKDSCLTYGEDISLSFEKNYDKGWHEKSYTWELPNIIGKVSPWRNKVDYHLQQFFQMLEKCKIRNNLSSYNTKRSKTYNSLAEREGYTPMLPLMGENFIALLLYLRDFTYGELKYNYWAKYNISLTLYALSQMTCWITPFTTEPIQYLMPLFDPYHPLTCDYFNKKMTLEMLDIQNPMLRYSDFSAKYNDNEQNTPLAYISDFYNELQQWYYDSTEIEQKTFDDYVAARFSILYESFINCKSDNIYIPTEKDLRLSSKHTPNLGYFYCLCDHFISYQLPDLLLKQVPELPVGYFFDD